MAWLRLPLLLVAFLVGTCGCGETGDGPDGRACVELPQGCTPQYEPTFDNIHSRTLTASCAVSGGACHANAGAAGGFSMAEAEEAYDGVSSRVSDDSGCGLLARRLFSDDPSFQMPPGKPLSDGELCAIAKWLEAGAAR